MQNSNALWYKDAIIYQLHVKSFCDSNDDGIGDFSGLTRKLDYLRDLGVTALWLLPFYPSPLRDDGYDIADYYGIHPDYGTMRDFRRFLKEAHSRGLKVITELVINHTSDQHAWFRKSHLAKPGSAARDFYLWSRDPNRFSDARVIFQDYEASNWTWDPVAKAYYWHRFFSHQPDLNFENPRVREAILKVMEFWLAEGVDGLRLDAVPYLFEREGTTCENLPETHEFLKTLRSRMDERFPDRMLLAEANQWPEDAIAYFGYGDECHMAFHFPIMPRLFMSLWMENSCPVVDILEQTPPIPDNCQWVTFLRNHDELTLEMVTEEERDYMVRVFAKDPRARINLGIRRRLFPLLQKNRRKAELLNFLLFSLPGTPSLYYGDEIGMGDNYFLGDRDGVRTPMQWSPDRNAGFSRANPQKLCLPVITDPEYAYEAVNVENQERNPSSMLWWMRRLIAMRKRHPAFSRGETRFLQPKNPKVLSFLRSHGDETILVVANLSRFAQVVELDLAGHAGVRPVELFGGNRFPLVTEAPYLLTLGPHDHLWLKLSGERLDRACAPPADELPAFQGRASWKDLPFSPQASRDLETALQSYLDRCPRAAPGDGPVQALSVGDGGFLETPGGGFHLLLLSVSRTEGIRETCFVPLGFEAAAGGNPAAEPRGERRVARVVLGGTPGFLYDAAEDPGFHRAVLEFARERGHRKGRRGGFSGVPGKALRAWRGNLAGKPSRILASREGNAVTAAVGEDFTLKLFTRPEEGINPEVEIGRFLAEKARFLHAPPFLGALEYLGPGGKTALGAIHGFVGNQGTAWDYVGAALGQFRENAMAAKTEPGAPVASAHEMAEAFFFEMVDLLGERTGEMHLALASDHEDPAFSPEPFTKSYQRSVYQSIRSLSREVFRELKGLLPSLEGELKSRAEALMPLDREVLAFLGPMVSEKLSGLKIRIHGNYHLEKVLFTGKDFFLTGFEGEPERSLSERRLKRSALRDVARMLRSFDQAAWAFCQGNGHTACGLFRDDWLADWRKETAARFLGGYARALGPDESLQPVPRDRDNLVRVFMLECCLHELKAAVEGRAGTGALEFAAGSVLELLRGDAAAEKRR